MTTSKSIHRGRTAFAKEEWKDAFIQLSRAETKESLPSQDLELLAISAYLTGNFTTCFDTWTRAHNSFVQSGDTRGAARCAFWLGFTLVNKGETVRGSGWMGHARKILDENPIDCAEQGYLFLPVALAALSTGNIQGSIDAFKQAMEIGNRFRDQNLITLGTLGQGQALIRMGREKEGIALLDEAMVSVDSSALSPIVMGIVYCAVIEACLEMFDLTRATEWTGALSDWCSSHPHLVPFRGQCLMRRSEIMQIHGEWDDAIKEVNRAIALLSTPTPEPAAASAYYQLGDLYRLKGAYTQAEAAYNEASKLGRNPQPGLALLRLAQGQIDRSKSSINNALTETKKIKNKYDALFACIEIMLEDGNSEQARATLLQLKKIVHGHDAPFLRALSSQAEGAVLLAEGKTDSALTSLREARDIWEELKAPYDVARTRSLMALAYQRLGDDDSAQLECEAARWTFEQLKALPDVARIDEAFKSQVPKSTNGLTLREKQVLQLIAEGKSNKSIAEKLFISERTVERHVSNIFSKLDVASRSEATAHAYKHNLL